MTDFNYKKYSLENLENWVHDTLSDGQATPVEIYDTIKKVVEEQYYYHKQHTSQAYELLALLNGNGINFQTETKDNKVPLDTILQCNKDDPSAECKSAWNDFWDSNNTVEYDLREAEYYNKKSEVVKWVLPIEVDGPSGEYYIILPDDLLQAANLKEGDKIEWINNHNKSFTLRKKLSNSNA